MIRWVLTVLKALCLRSFEKVTVPILEALVVLGGGALLFSYLLAGAEPRTGGREGSLVSEEQVFPLPFVWTTKGQRTEYFDFSSMGW